MNADFFLREGFIGFCVRLDLYAAYFNVVILVNENGVWYEGIPLGDGNGIIFLGDGNGIILGEANGSTPLGELNTDALNELSDYLADYIFKEWIPLCKNLLADSCLVWWYYAAFLGVFWGGGVTMLTPYESYYSAFICCYFVWGLEDGCIVLI